MDSQDQQQALYRNERVHDNEALINPLLLQLRSILIVVNSDSACRVGKRAGTRHTKFRSLGALSRTLLIAERAVAHSLITPWTTDEIHFESSPLHPFATYAVKVEISVWSVEFELSMEPQFPEGTRRLPNSTMARGQSKQRGAGGLNK